MTCFLQVYVRFDKPLEACTSPFFSFQYFLPRLDHGICQSTSPLSRLYTLPDLLRVNNTLRACEKALAELLLCGAGVQAALPLGSPPPLLDQSVASLSEVAHLVVLHALEPVAEAGADKTVDGVGEEALAVKEGAHLDAELP